MINRRTFIKNTSLATFSTIIAPSLLKAASFKKDIGLQLYTLRDLITKDLQGTLEKIAETGYTWLEAAGYNDGKFYGIPPGEFKKMVQDLGMRVISSHTAFKPEQQQQVIDSHLDLGTSYIVYPWMSMPEIPTRDDYSRAASLFNQLGDACKSSGIRFGYHNHAFEFVKTGDTTGFDLLLTLTDPELVCFETDLYWMVFAGEDPVDYFRKFPGRFELWHVKDMEDNPEKDFAPVGKGIIDFRRIFDQKELSGLTYFFVEQDSCKIDPLESIRISYNKLKKIAY